MLKLIVIFSFLFMGCNLKLEEDKPDVCAENMAVMTTEFLPEKYKDAKVYDQPMKGFSCQEFEARKPKPMPRSNSCVDYAYALDDIAEATNASQSEQNTVVKGVTESRKLVYDTTFSYQINNEGLVNITLLNNTKETYLLSTKTQYAKLLLYNDYLIVTQSIGYSVRGYELKIYDVSNKKSIKEIFDKRLGHIQAAYLRGSELFLYEATYDVVGDCEDIYYVDESTDNMLLSTFRMNLSANELELKKGKVLYGNYSIHLDLNAEYFYKKNYYFDKTILLKDDTELSMSSFTGRIPGKFAIKEYDDHLAAFIQNENSSSLKVFDQNLVEVNEIDEVAAGERIYSSRFMQERAYLVTFRQVDPLFTFDLTEISEPKLIGELKIPGVSHYLHPLSKDLLLGVGILRSQVEISLFDVSTQSDALKVDSLLLDDQRYLDVFYDHQKITVTGNIILLEAGKDIIVLRLEQTNLVELGQVSSGRYSKEIMIYNDILNVFTDNSVKQYELREGVPEIK
jgi:hypothetical protein